MYMHAQCTVASLRVPPCSSIVCEGLGRAHLRDFILIFGAGALSWKPSPQLSPTAFRLVVVDLVEDDSLDENERSLVFFSCFIVFLGPFASPDDSGSGEWRRRRMVRKRG